MQNNDATNHKDEILSWGKQVIATEVKEIVAMANRLGEEFVAAVQLIISCKGKVVVSGMGKSGHIGKKISATLASTGTTSMFMHPGEAYHGDLGVISTEDIVLLISNSGETDEILKIIPFLQSQGNKTLAFTGNTQSTLALACSCCLDVGVEVEACNLNLAPTSSTTATLVMGDALAVAVMKVRGFRQEDFARFHPGGNLGRKLLSKVENAMVQENLPLISPDTGAVDALHAVSAGRIGAAVVVDEQKKLLGIITDGDIRRALVREKSQIFNSKAKDFMTLNPRSIAPEVRLIDAEMLMDELNIHQLVVVDTWGKVVGLLPYRESK